MNVPANSNDINSLYQEFSDSFRANDDEAVRRIYRELLRLGRPRAEVMDEALRLASTASGAFGNSAATGSEILFSVDQPTRRPTIKRASADMTENPTEVVSSIWDIFERKTIAGESVVEPDAELTSKDSREEAPADVSGDDPEANRKIGFLFGSPAVRLSVAFGGITVAVVTALAFLPARSAGEKPTTPAASSASSLAPAQNSIATVVPPSPQPAASPGNARNGQDPPRSPEDARKTGRAVVDRDANNRSTVGATPNVSAASSANQPIADTRRPVGSAETSPGTVEPSRVVSLSPVTGDEPATSQMPDRASTSSQRPNNRAAPGVFAPHPAPTAVSPAAVAEGLEPPLSGGDVAALLTRGDSLFGTGDLAAARLFYERAVSADNGEAALRLGESYDPRFLQQAHIRGARGDITAAIFWYKRARDLGMDKATILIESLSSK